MLGKMRIVRDMMGRKISVPVLPMRIVSLVPSQTELLYDLGLGERVVGITKFCVHPEVWFREKARIGGTKTVDIEKVKALQPDLIIANKEENTQADIEALAEFASVWVSNIYDLNGALEMILQVGEITQTAEQAKEICAKIKDNFAKLKAERTTQKVAYAIWKNPWMWAGRDIFIASMLREMGWENVLENETRYPEKGLADIAALKPEIILLSSEPFPFKEKHLAEVKAEMPDAKVLLADGEMFSWYGSRLLLAVNYFQELQKQLAEWN